MVLMGMADEDGSRSGPIQRRRQQAGGAFRSVEWPPGVENKTVAIRMHDFDAGPADLLRPAMDGELQAHVRTRAAFAPTT